MTAVLQLAPGSALSGLNLPLNVENVLAALPANHVQSLALADGLPTSVVTDTVATVTDTLAPVTDTLAPVTNTLAPVTNAVAPVTSAAAPVTNLVQPVVDTVGQATGLTQQLNSVLPGLGAL